MPVAAKHSDLISGSGGGWLGRIGSRGSLKGRRRIKRRRLLLQGRRIRSRSPNLTQSLCLRSMLRRNTACLAGGSGVAFFQRLAAHPAVADDPCVRAHLFLRLAPRAFCAAPPEAFPEPTLPVEFARRKPIAGFRTRFTVRSHDRSTPLSAGTQKRPTIASEMTAIAIPIANLGCRINLPRWPSSRSIQEELDDAAALAAL